MKKIKVLFSIIGALFSPTLAIAPSSHGGIFRYSVGSLLLELSRADLLDSFFLSLIFVTLLVGVLYGLVYYGLLSLILNFSEEKFNILFL